jgi:hypothetical protein
MLDTLRMTVERLSTELDASKVREADILRKAEQSANELECLRKHVSGIEEQRLRQAAEVSS